MLIQPKTYEYIDKVERGNDIVYGFIAQQIKEVIPEAVKIEKCIIPNIFKVCQYNNDVISLPPEEINKLKEELASKLGGTITSDGKVKKIVEIEKKIKIDDSHKLKELEE